MPEPAPDANQLRRECEAFSRYLLGAAPTEYVIGKYLRGHGNIPYLHGGRPARIDRVLVTLALGGRLPARVADAYGRCFRPAGALRQKLALLLAILENSPPYEEYLNSADTSGRPSVAAAIVLQGTAFLLSLLTGMLLLGPIQIVLRIGPDRGTRSPGRG